MDLKTAVLQAWKHGDVKKKLMQKTMVVGAQAHVNDAFGVIHQNSTVFGMHAVSMRNNSGGAQNYGFTITVSCAGIVSTHTYTVRLENGGFWGDSFTSWATVVVGSPMDYRIDATTQIFGVESDTATAFNYLHVKA